MTGFTNLTYLYLEGTVDGQPLLVTLLPYTDDVEDFAIGPGTYTGGGTYVGANGRAVRRSGSDQCDETTLDEVKVVVTKHAYTAGDDGFQTGDVVMFQGSVAVHGGGWSLELPFDITTACVVSVDL
ncbi:MAG: hypothetical protein QM778_17435 [Myxococcales bacterium]